MVCKSKKNTRYEKVAHGVQLSIRYRQKLHTYNYTHTEEEEEKMEIKQKEFNDFIQWLKQEGVKIKVNERWWKRRIFTRLLNNHSMTLENWNDFQESKHKSSLVKNEDETYHCDPFLMLGIKIKYKNGTVRKVKKSIDADSFIHLFFEDGSDELLHKKICQQILESQH